MDVRRAVRLALVVTAIWAIMLPAALAGAQPRVKVRYGQSGDTLVFFPMYVARDRGYFAEEGIDLETVILGGGPALLAAQVGGSIDIQDTTLFHLVKAHEQGLQLLAFASVFQELGLDLVLSSEAYRRLGLNAASSLEEKVRALKGLRIGISSAGASTDLMARNLLTDYGLNPDTYVSLQPMGSGGPLLAALERGVIDAFIYPPPFPEAAELRGVGKVLVSTTKGEVAKWRGFQYQILAAPKKYMEENPKVMLGLARGLAKALKLTRDNPVEAKRSVKKYFPKIEEAVLEAALNDTLHGVPKTPYLTKRGYELNEPFLNAGGAKKFGLPPFEQLTTNEFAERAMAELGLQR